MNTLLLHILALQMETATLEIRSLLKVPRGPRRPVHLQRLDAALERGKRLLQIAEFLD